MVFPAEPKAEPKEPCGAAPMETVKRNSFAISLSYERWTTMIDMEKNLNLTSKSF